LSSLAMRRCSDVDIKVISLFGSCAIARSRMVGGEGFEPPTPSV
jgi:hypothetical protein